MKTYTCSTPICTSLSILGGPKIFDTNFISTWLSEPSRSPNSKF